MSSDEEDPPTILVATRVDEYDGPLGKRSTVSFEFQIKHCDSLLTLKEMSKSNAYICMPVI